MAQLICASTYPVSLLTDLKDHWYFFWFTEVKGKTCLVDMRLKYPKNAFDFIEKIALGKGDEPLKIPFSNESFKKLKVNNFMKMPADSNDELMKRYELMSDVLEPEFFMERRREYFLHKILRSTIFSHMLVSKH
ncbi:crinkler (CRN) domain-containing protein [Thraustotheca clavata]|uniref:Crinkler (CRN) domain-containing protein n=1 Tax=Thraustotheca clavata TaxID=74557 RepID=A0A1V9ZPZ4_9STRA|nr:crinkler (CRN) domain-containing protein [Thraustotheca clavata]